MDCVLKAAKFVDDSGKFDPTLAKTTLKAATGNKKAWVRKISLKIVCFLLSLYMFYALIFEQKMDLIVDNCTARDLNETENEAENEETNGSQIHCDIPENIGKIKCISRQLVFNCPTWTQNNDCDELMEFVKTCPHFGGVKKVNKKGKRMMKKQSQNHSK